MSKFKKGKVLADLNLKVGDKVKCTGWSDGKSVFCVGNVYTIVDKHPFGLYNAPCAWSSGGWQRIDSDGDTMLFEVVSRATPVTDYNDGKWHGWNGGECPVHPETVVEVVGGYSEGSDTALAGDTVYWHNVVAFRVVTPYDEPEKPRDFYIAIVNGEPGDIATDMVALEDYGYSNIVHVREVLE